MLNRMTDATTGWVPEDDFSARLLLARKQAGLTVKEAAMRCGLHYATWSTWERGARPADMAAVVNQISEALGVDRTWLAWGGALAPERSTELGHGKRAVRRNALSRSRCTRASAQRKAAKRVRRSWVTMTPTHGHRPAA